MRYAVCCEAMCTRCARLRGSTDGTPSISDCLRERPGEVEGGGGATYFCVVCGNLRAVFTTALP